MTSLAKSSHNLRNRTPTTFTKTISTALGLLPQSRRHLFITSAPFTTHHSLHCHLLTPLRVVSSELILTCTSYFHHAKVRTLLRSNMGRQRRRPARYQVNHYMSERCPKEQVRFKFDIVKIPLHCILHIPLLIMQYNIHSLSNLSNDRSKASSKTIPPHSAI